MKVCLCLSVLSHPFHPVPNCNESQSTVPVQSNHVSSLKVKEERNFSHVKVQRKAGKAGRYKEHETRTQRRQEGHREGGGGGVRHVTWAQAGVQVGREKQKVGKEGVVVVAG